MPVLGVDWHRVKDAIEHRRKLDKEDADADMPGGYKRVSRKQYSNNVKDHLEPGQSRHQRLASSRCTIGSTRRHSPGDLQQLQSLALNCSAAAGCLCMQMI